MDEKAQVTDRVKEEKQEKTGVWVCAGGLAGGLGGDPP